ncbi:MAG: hypothetical protein U1D26_02050 [Patescibacteria group bacterium]|nr:hypothetical protein [bacterium]MDZ4227239.1 hypothetical protein [Patescibacteria group bacterium]
MNKSVWWLIGVLVILAGLAYSFRDHKVILQPAPAMQESAASAEKTQAALVGTWRSTQDPKFVREFRADGTVTDSYEGEPSATSVGTYASVGASQTDLQIPASALEGMSIIAIEFPDTGTLYFAVATLTDTSLEMIYISGMGNVLSFTKVR